MRSSISVSDGMIAKIFAIVVAVPLKVTQADYSPIAKLQSTVKLPVVEQVLPFEHQVETD